MSSVDISDITVYGSMDGQHSALQGVDAVTAQMGQESHEVGKMFATVAKESASLRPEVVTAVSEVSRSAKDTPPVEQGTQDAVANMSDVTRPT